MNFDEAMQIRVAIEGIGPALESLGWLLIRCCALLTVGRVLAALIRACGR